MNRRIASLVLAGCVVAISGGVAHALGITLTPGSGPPGTAFTAEVACEETAEFYVVVLREGNPPGTIPPLAGVESEPGLWTLQLDAAERDLRVTATCGEEAGTARFDVDLPAMFPGPTWTNIGNWRPDRDRTTVVGTDCAAGRATATFNGAGGATETVTAPTDDFGDWEAAIPYAIPAGPVTVAATCGDIAYGPITFERQGPAAPLPTTPATPPAPVPGPGPRPASPAPPMTGTPGYTG